MSAKQAATNNQVPSRHKWHRTLHGVLRHNGKPVLVRPELVRPGPQLTNFRPNLDDIARQQGEIARTSVGIVLNSKKAVPSLTEFGEC